MNRLMGFLSTLAVAFSIFGCDTAKVESLEEQLGDGSTDQATNVVSQPVVVTPTDVPATTTQTVVDKDLDGYTGKNDCDESKAGVNKYATEICNGIDDNCDGQTDEELTAKLFTDKDHDGFGLSSEATTVCLDAPSIKDYAKNSGDCSDSTADDDNNGSFDGYSVHPGADEICGDKVDNNCNGVVDEFPCVSYESGEILQAEPEESLLQLVVAFANPATRTVSLVEYSNADQVGSKWLTSTTSTQSTIKAPINSVNAKCGVRFNVAIGVPADKWLCMGHGTESTLDPEAKFYLELKNEEGWYDVTDQVIPWSDPDSDGCSALLVLTEEGECNLNLN